MFKVFKNNLLNKQFRSLYDSNHAVVGIVVAVLLIGLVVTVLSVIQLVYVPNWMEEIESEHIDDVFDQFSQLKLVIDTQSAIKKPLTPIVTSINLGTNKIPFFMSTQAAGGLEIVRYNQDDACIVEIVNDTFLSNDPYTCHLGTIKYTSANAYYIPSERISFIYENGALITNQTSGNALNIKPSFGINSTGGLYFDLVNISDVGGKISKYGYDTDHIRTEYYTYTDSIVTTDPPIETFYNVSYLRIITPHWDVWKPFIIDVMEDLKDDYGYTYSSFDTPGIVEIHFTHPNKLPDIELRFTGIYAQIGPGWVET
jgi:hypothetical protein